MGLVSMQRQVGKRTMSGTRSKRSSTEVLGKWGGGRETLDIYVVGKTFIADKGAIRSIKQPVVPPDSFLWHWARLALFQRQE